MYICIVCFEAVHMNKLFSFIKIGYNKEKIDPEAKLVIPSLIHAYT